MLRLSEIVSVVRMQRAVGELRDPLPHGPRPGCRDPGPDLEEPVSERAPESVRVMELAHLPIGAVLPKPAPKSKSLKRKQKQGKQKPQR